MKLQATKYPVKGNIWERKHEHILQPIQREEF
jgi:hypothetical protein